MPEMEFAVRWPDGGRTTHYSPSLVMHNYLVVGSAYPIDEFVARASTALGIASERVRAKYGVACTSAMATQEAVAARAEKCKTGEVTVVRMEPPLPGGAS